MSIFGGGDLPMRLGQRGSVPFTFDVSALSLPTGGGANTTVNRFVLVPHDTSVDAIYLIIPDGAASGGTLTFQFYQELSDGVTQFLTQVLSLAGRPTDAQTFGAPLATLRVGFPVYLRMIAYPPASGAAWWDTSTFFNGTLHLLSTDNEQLR